MTGQMRPRRMSLEQAQSFVEHPAPPEGTPWDVATPIGQPVDAEPVLDDTADSDQRYEDQAYGDSEMAERLRKTLLDNGIDPDELLVDTDPETVTNPAPEAESLRPLEALEADVDFVCGPGAIANDPGHRHLVMLRLIDDLLDARAAFDELRRLVSLVGGS